MSDYTSIDPTRCALVIIDVQADFVDGALPVPGTAAALPALRQVISAFRDVGRPVVHVIRYYEPGGSDVDLDHAALVSGQVQQIGPAEVVVYKPRWTTTSR